MELVKVNRLRLYCKHVAKSENKRNETREMMFNYNIKL